MARELKCNYKMCDNFGVAVDPIKYKNKYYCKECLKKLKHEIELQEKEKELKQRNSELRKQIMDITLEILPKEIPSLINKVTNQWVSLGYSMEYILYTINYIRINRCILNHVHGVRYYMNKDDIKNQYNKLKAKEKLKQLQHQEFETTEDVVEFKPTQETNNWSDLI
jgi:hypothetical protein